MSTPLPIPIDVAGVTAEVVDRRRYGTTTYTWVEFVTPDGRRHSCHDPWPTVTPKRSEVEEQARILVSSTHSCRCDVVG